MNKHLHELYISMIKELYCAEELIISKGLPEMIGSASNAELKRGLEEHLEQSKVHLERLEKIASNQEIEVKGKNCPGMDGLLAEGKAMLSMDLEGNAKDFAIVSAAQKIEHFEMSSYSSALMLAELMEHDDDIDLLEETLDEEVETSQRLDEVVENLLMELEDVESDDVDEEEDLEE